MSAAIGAWNLRRKDGGDRKLIPVGLRGLEQPNERVLRKRVSLGGDGKMRGRGGVPRLAVAGLDPLLLLQTPGREKKP